MNNNITTDQLLDCLTSGQQLITPQGMSDLRSTLRDLGYGGAGMSLPTTYVDDVIEVANLLVEQGKAKWCVNNWLEIVTTLEPLTLVVNWDAINQALQGTTDEEQEEFVRLAREYASDKGWKFETIRNIQRPGFFLSEDGETILPDQEDETTAHFCRICERMTA